MQLEVLQEKTFGSIQEWANKQFNVTLATSNSLYGCEQHPDVPLAYAAYLNKLPYPQLVALSELAGACKSLLIAFALHGGHTSVHEVLHLAEGRVDEVFYTYQRSLAVATPPQDSPAVWGSIRVGVAHALQSAAIASLHMSFFLRVTLNAVYAVGAFARVQAVWLLDGSGRAL